MDNIHMSNNIPRLSPRVPLQAAGWMDSVFKVGGPARLLLPRADSSTSSSSSSQSAGQCGDNACEKPIGSSNYTLPIALGVAIPVLGALITFVLLHRRHIKRQRLEDANDRHASMDFGMGNVAQRQKKKGSNDKAMDLGGGDEKPGGGLSHRQISMDMGMSVHSPYLLPPELQNSRESLHSLSRTLHEQEDPYRPVKEYYPGDGSSMRSQSKQGSSIYTGSSHAPSRLQESGTSDLLSNAGQMGRVSPPTAAFPPRQNSLLSRTTSLSPVEPGANPFAPQPYPVEPAQAYFPGSVITRKELPNNSHPGQGSEPTSDGRRSLTSSEGEKNSGYPGTMAQPRGFSSTPSPPPEQALPADPVRKSPPPPINAYPMNAGPVRKDSIPFVQAQHAYVEDVGQYDEGFRVTPPSPTLDNAEAMRGQRYSMDVPPEQFAQAGLGAPGFDAKRLSMGFRPLPPNATSESEDPETRANRIRSFYKEYFDESKPLPQGQYYEDYDETYLGEAAYYDPDSNAFVMPAPHHPYAEPITRHAMTPPPRGPPRFQPQSQYRDRQGSMGTMSTMSGGRGPPSGPRAYSSASGRMGPPRGPKRPVPPPSDLTTLPTPSKLRDDAFALNPLDFAPPKTYRDRVAGRSESPLGERRPYSPMVPAFAPTASTFDELQPMPSPHMLRKSGTFTSLDFAAPRKFRDPENMSDAGSIRSNGSVISSRQQFAIRNGAYRVSKIPADVVFTKDDLATTLKPQWGLRSS